MLTEQTTSWQDNDIRNHLGGLVKVPGEKDKWYCPVCEGSNLSIGDNGYTCFSNYCDRTEILIEAKKRDGTYVEHRSSSHSHKPQIKPKANKAKSKLKFKPVSIDRENLTQAQFPSVPIDIPKGIPLSYIDDSTIYNPTKGQVRDKDIIVTIYDYLPNRVIRYQWKDESNAKGREKTQRWQHWDEEQQRWVNKKLEGHQDHPYRFNEVIAHASGKCFLAVEGEKNVEACRNIGSVATDTSQLTKSPQCLESMREKDITIVIVPDKDKAGIEKAKKLEQACLEHRVKYLILDVYQWWKDKPDKYDIADYISDPNMNAEEIIKVLNYQIKQAMETKFDDRPVDNAASSDTSQENAVKATQIVNIEVAHLNKAELVDFVDKEYGDDLRFNTRKQQIEMKNVSVDMSVIDMELAKVHHIECRQDNAIRAFQYVALKNQYDPVKNWLEEIKEKASQGDIKPVSIDNLSTRFLGTADSVYDTYVKKFLISAVARVYNPGCKVDTVLVLQGKQGCGKSTFFKVLGKDWYGDSMSIAAKKGNTADELATAARSWINEYPEIEGIVSNKDIAEFKEFVSRDVDTYRIPYDKTPQERSRNFVIVGTTNEEEFLKDPTGNRRFWVIPVAVENTIDTLLIEEELEGIWASAVEAYLNDEPWHLSQIEEEARERLNKKFQVSDEWENPIGDYLQAKETSAIELNKEPTVTIKELLKVIGQNPDDKKSQDRVSKILKLLGWKKLGQRTINKERKTVWNNPSTLLHPSNLKLEVKQPETIDIQGTSTATTATTGNSKTLVEERDNTISEKDNISNLSCQQNSSNTYSTCSTYSNPSQGKTSSSTTPTATPRQGSSTQIAIETNQLVTIPIDNIENPATHDSADREKTTANTDNEEKRYLQVCDVAGIPLQTGDMVQRYSDHPQQSTRLIGTIFYFNKLRTGGIDVIVKWGKKEKIGVHAVKDNGDPFPQIDELRKVVERNGRYVAAMN